MHAFNDWQTMDPKLNRFLRYTGVNLASMCVDYGIFLPLTHAFGHPVLQSIIAYSAALSINYQLTKRFVFTTRVSHKSELRLMTEFFATGIVGLALTALVTGITITDLRMPPVEGKTVAVILCFFVLYVVRSRLVFTDPAPHATL